MSSTRPLLPTTRNITRAFRLASADDVADGRAWYSRANSAARTLAADFDVDVTVAAAVIAVLSPMTSWPLNIRRAREAFESPETVSFLNAGKARRLIVDREAPGDVVSGPKVSAFYSTIVDPDNAAVTVDRHAIHVAVGRNLTDDERARVVSRKGAYDALAALYVRAAEILSAETGKPLTAAQVQATTWVYWRRNRAVANHG